MWVESKPARPQWDNDAVLDGRSLAKLRSDHRGPVIDPADPSFVEARQTFNALSDRRPLVIVRPVDARDAVIAVAFARDHGLPISVRGGGHSVAGHCAGDDSVMIDLRLLREVAVDPVGRTATVGGGALWSDVDARTQGYGLAMPGGTYGDTGVGGLTLSGGIGHLLGAFGMTLDNLVSATVVTAAGGIVRADAEQEPDLYWALRGGGGNFGIVTEFVSRVHEVGIMTGGLLAHRLQYATRVLRAFRDMSDGTPDALTCMPQLFPSSLLGERERIFLTSVAYLGPPDEAEPFIQPLYQAAAPVHDTIGPMGYLQVQALFPPVPFGLRHYWTGRFLRELPDDVIDSVVERFAEGPDSSDNCVLFEPFHGAARRVDPLDTAFGHRDARFNVSPMAIWEDPSLDEQEIEWAAGIRGLLEPLSFGGYLNYATDDSAETVTGAFGLEAFARLRAVKARWDPDNVFRFNHNIPPTVP